MRAPSWFDSHCHLDDCADVEATLSRAGLAGVDFEICVGTGLDTSRAAVQIAKTASERGACVYATVGLHPHDARDGVEPVVAFATEMFDAQGPATVAAPGSVVAIGECGLDYFYEHSERHTQREVFARQINLAKQLGTTLVVHTRDAWDDTLSILESEGAPGRVVVHCFSGGAPEAKRCLDLGAFLSFSGIVTFKNAHDVRSAAQLCPIDRMLVETDAPFLAPVPHRGKVNEPAFAALVGSALAELRSVRVEELAERTTQNAFTAFNIAR